MSKIELDRCGNWYKFKIWPEGRGIGKRRFIDGDSGILAFCDISLKDWHLSWWQPRHDRISRRMAEIMKQS